MFLKSTPDIVRDECRVGHEFGESGGVDLSVVVVECPVGSHRKEIPYPVSSGYVLHHKRVGVTISCVCALYPLFLFYGYAELRVRF